MTKLVVHLLGGYLVELDGEAVYDFETDKARSLLAYLIVEADRPHRRETLAGLLWPDRPDSVARANLRQALARVRRALRDHAPLFLFVTSTDVQFNAAGDYTLDVAALEAFARSPARHAQLLPERFCADFLAGFSVPDSETFQEWVLSKQEHYHRLAIEILREQNAYFEGLGDYDQAAGAARLQLRLEPWLEEAHRRCMRALALAGRRDEALRQYEACCRALATELDVEPAAGTQALYADIRAGKLVPAARPAPPVAAAGSPAPPGSARPDPTPSPWRAPSTRIPPPARLVARADELGRLGRHLDAALAGETGVAFVSGDAGSGKTALLEALAASAMAEHPDLLVAGARCSPGGGLDPLAPLRKLAEMLFGDLASDVAWRLAGPAQVQRLQAATALALASLTEHGLGLVDTLVPAASVARRAGPFSQGVMTHSVVAGQPAWLDALNNGPKPATTPVQGALFDQLICTLAAMAQERPLLLLLDDLHWVDDASVAFLLRLGRELTGRGLLVLGAYRSATVALGRRDPSSGERIRHPLAVALNELRRARGEIVVELDRADGRAFVEAYVDTEPNRLGAGFRDALYAQTGGHALFTVETLRNLQERGELFRDEAGRWAAHDSLDWAGLPARVEAAIAERIDRLPERCRRLLACASVEGDEFSAELVAELADAPAGEVLACLSGTLAREHHLVRPEGLQRAGGGQRSTFRFAHHLFQKYLYTGLDPVERAQLHSAVAAALDRQAGDDPTERERLSARLAWHYEAGGLPVQAARALLDAGRQAMRVSAFQEALNRFDHGLALLAALRPSSERTYIEGLLEVARLGPLRNLQGMAGAGLQDALARAAKAWSGAPGGGAQGRTRLLLLRAEAERLLATGQLAEGLAAAEQMRAEATQWGEEDFVALAQLYAGITHHFGGHPQESERHLDALLGWLTPDRQAGLRAALGIDLLANALAYSALNRWFMGSPEAALTRSRQAMDGARAGGATVGQAAAAALGANLLFLLRVDERAMAEQSEQCYRLSLEHGIGMWQALAEVLVGRLAIMRGDLAGLAGIERIRSAMARWQAMGLAIGVDFFVVVLADSCLLGAGRLRFRDHPTPLRSGDCSPTPLRSGDRDADDAARLLAAGLAAIEGILGPAGKQCWQGYEAELRRLRGELLLTRDGLAASAEALACFTKSLQFGREQGALAWELRAAMSLVRLRERQHDPRSAAEWGSEGRLAELAEARACLRDVYARFTEGFAFPDLQDAAVLLGGADDSLDFNAARPGAGAAGVTR